MVLNSLLNLLPATLGDSPPPHLILSTASTSIPHSSISSSQRRWLKDRGFRAPLPVIVQDSLHARGGASDTDLRSSLSVATRALTASDGDLQLTESDSLTHPFAMLQLSLAHLCIQSCSLPAECLLLVYPQVNPTVPGAPYHRCPMDYQRPQEKRVCPFPHLLSHCLHVCHSDSSSIHLVYVCYSGCIQSSVTLK